MHNNPCIATVQPNEKSHRQSNFELLRIVAMIMIVAFHLAVHSGFELPNDRLGVNRLWILFIQIGGKIGVDIFVLISGYFLILAERIKMSKVVKLWTQLLFYSIVFFIIFIAVGTESFGYIKFAKQFAPVCYSRWWFASTYFVLYLFSPYINIFLRTLNKKQYLGFLALLFVLWCLLPTLMGLQIQGNPLLWFVFLYALAGYFRLFGIHTKRTGGQLILFAVIWIVGTFLLAVIIDYIGIKHPVIGAYATFFYDMQKFPILMISTLLFLGFSKLEIGYSKAINTIGAATFGVYLIHDYDHVRDLLWLKVFKNASYSGSKLLIPHTLFAIAVVFIGCTIIELLRINLIEKNCWPILEKIASIIDRKRKALFTSGPLSRLGKE